MMAALIFDASGIVKRYIHEVGSAWVQVCVDPSSGHKIYVSRMTLVEVTAAIVRRGKTSPSRKLDVASILARLHQDIADQYRILEITPIMLDLAARLAEIHALRGYDAVQLAATLDLQRARQAVGLSTLELISSDAEWNLAATAEGLAVTDPTIHP